jgi:hypothetical protein
MGGADRMVTRREEASCLGVDDCGLPGLGEAAGDGRIEVGVAAGDGVGIFWKGMRSGIWSCFGAVGVGYDGGL